MKTNLMKLLWIKEKRHWKRTFEVFSKFNNWFGKLTLGIVLAVLGTVVHIAFVLMSTAWQSLMFVFFRKQFKLNLQRQALRV